MLGRCVSDLEVGDVLGPLTHVLTAALIREYAHGVENASDRHHSSEGLIAPPTIFHAEKKRLLDYACPEGSGPAPLVHLEYDAIHRQAIPADRSLTVVGRVVERMERNGRQRIVIDFEIADESNGILYGSYHDTTLLGYEKRS